MSESEIISVRNNQVLTEANARMSRLNKAEKTQQRLIGACCKMPITCHIPQIPEFFRTERKQKPMNYTRGIYCQSLIFFSATRKTNKNNYNQWSLVKLLTYRGVR